MDQIKIGRFIASCRKDAGFTQAVLAENLELVTVYWHKKYVDLQHRIG